MDCCIHVEMEFEISVSPYKEITMGPNKHEHPVSSRSEDGAEGLTSQPVQAQEAKPKDSRPIMDQLVTKRCLSTDTFVDLINNVRRHQQPVHEVISSIKYKISG